MILSCLMALAWAAPRSQRAVTSAGLFRDPLDHLDQPAQMADDQAANLYTQLAWRTSTVTPGAGVVMPVAKGTLGVWLQGSRGSWASTDSAGQRRDEHNALSGDLGWAGRRGAFAWGLAASASLTTAAEGTTWRPAIGWIEGPAPEGAPIARDLTAEGTITGGLRFGQPGGWVTVDVHGTFGWAYDATFIHGTTPRGVDVDGFLVRSPAAALQYTNTSGPHGGLVLDATAALRPGVQLRVWGRLNLSSAGEAIAHGMALGPGGVAAPWTTTGRAEATDGSLTVVAQVQRGKVDLRTGLRTTASSSSSTAEFAGSGAAWTSAWGRSTIALELPLAMEVAVHRDVTLRLAGSVGSLWSKSFGTANLTVPLRDTATRFTQAVGDGAAGLRWSAAPVLDIDLGGTLAVGTSAAWGGSAGAPFNPKHVPLRIGGTTLPGTTPVTLAGAVSLVLHPQLRR